MRATWARRTGTVIAATAMLVAVGSVNADAGRHHRNLKRPAGLHVGEVTSHSIDLSWRDRSHKERFFQIRVRGGGRRFTARVGRDRESRRLAHVEADTKYRLRVRACRTRHRCGRYSRDRNPRTKPVRGPGPRTPSLAEMQFGYNEPVSPGETGLGLLAASGANFVRVPVSWAKLEPTPGSYRWDAVDGATRTLAARGLRPLWVLGTAPCWAARQPCRRDVQAPAPAPSAYDDYARAVVALARRHPAALGIEVWNEPNIAVFWGPHPNADAYRRLLTMAAARARAAGVAVPIVAAGPSPVTTADANRRHGLIATTAFLSAVLAGTGTPLGPAIDAVAIHPYGFNRGGDQLAAALDQYDRAAAVARRLAPQLPIWVTETGFTTAGKHALSRSAQSRDLTAMVGALARRGAALVAIHRFFDQPDHAYHFEHGMGVISGDHRTPKPAYCALAEQQAANPAVCPSTAG